MSKLWKWFEREGPLFWRYVVEVIKRWRAIVGSALVLGAIWVWSWLAKFPAIAEYMPDEILPWLTRNRLIVVSIFLVLLAAQYLAWRDSWLNRGTPDKPSLPKGVKLTQHASRSGGKTNHPERNNFEITWDRDLRGRVVKISCDTPIYEGYFWAHGSGSRAIDSTSNDVGHEDLRTITFYLTNDKIMSLDPVFMISGQLGASSAVPRITHVEWVEKAKSP